ncbi:hypothetical protein MZO31_03960 [Enterococcus faecium]|nr:hypothetical protein [Enterococcus faecium]UZN39294.1 hypothetical protein MZO31_03960 [Enterococcus faecium]
MKKLVWIYSVNTRGGILKSSGAGMIWSRSKKLQEQLRIKVEPEWDLSIISYDITTDTPQADLWNGNSFFDKFYKVQNFFPYAIPIVLDNEPPRM